MSDIIERLQKLISYSVYEKSEQTQTLLDAIAAIRERDAEIERLQAEVAEHQRARERQGKNIASLFEQIGKIETRRVLSDEQVERARELLVDLDNCHPLPINWYTRSYDFLRSLVEQETGK